MPIGTQNASLLDSRSYDEDADATFATLELFEEDRIAAPDTATLPDNDLRSELDLKRRVAAIYRTCAEQYPCRFSWARPDLFTTMLGRDLRSDAHALLRVLEQCGAWNPANDAKLAALIVFVQQTHPNAKVLVFTQFADTVRYLADQLVAQVSNPLLA